MTTPAKPKSPTRAYIALASVVVIGLGAYFGYGWYANNQASTDDAQVEADVVPIASRVGGQMLHVYVTDNQAVKKGDKIADIDPRDYEIKIAQAEGDFEAAEAIAEAAVSKGGAPVNVAQVESAKAASARAVAELRKAEADLARAKKLKSERAITAVEYENAVNTADKARAAADQAAAQTKMAEEQHGVAAAKVKSAQAALDQARAQLDYTKIVAPRDGTLSKVAVQEGQLVAPGQMLAQLVDNQTYLVANFKETQVGRMRAGQRVELEIDAFPGRRFEGKVESLAAATGARFSLLPPDNASGNFVKVVQRVPVKISWENAPKDVPFKAGLSADATVYFK